MNDCRKKAREDLPPDILIDYSPLERDANSRSEMEKLWEKLRPHIGLSSKRHFVGHRLAAPEHYPKNFNDNSRLHCYRGLKNLLYEGYEEVGCDSLELDLRSFCKQDDTTPILSITHDQPHPEKIDGEMMEYIEKNGFLEVLIEYVEKEYWRSHKLDLELKLQNEDFEKTADGLEGLVFKCDNDEKQLIDLILEVIEKVIGEHPEADAIRSSLRFVSFSLEALKYTHERAGNAYSYYFIATTNHPILKLLSVFFKELTPLGRKMIRKLKNDTPWLTGMWFDPKFIVNSVKTLSAIQAARVQPLELMVAAYYNEFDDIVEELSMGPDKLDVHGLIFDFCVPRPHFWYFRKLVDLLARFLFSSKINSNPFKN